MGEKESEVDAKKQWAVARGWAVLAVILLIFVKYFSGTVSSRKLPDHDFTVFFHLRNLNFTSDFL